MHIAIVNESIPYPATSGSRIRTLNLMLRLARKHRITYLCRGDGDSRAMHIASEYLADHGIQSIVVDDPPPPKSGLQLYARLAANVRSPLPYAVASHNSAKLRAAVGAYAARHAVDLWQYEWLAYADALSHLPSARSVLMAHNVESLIWERYWRVETNRLKRLFLHRQWQRFERLERRLFTGATCVVAVSGQDADLARQRFGTRNIRVVENGIDCEFFKAATGQRDHNRILFLGSLDWRPNQDAIRLLLDEIFPRVLEAAPQARLDIVGRNPPLWLKRRAIEQRHVDLHADVADVRPFLASSGVMTVPLRVGGGSRLKILEALACGLPVVSTTIGCEGLALTPGKEITVADSPQEMAAALIQILFDPLGAIERTRAAQANILHRHDWDRLAHSLENIWFDVAIGGAKTGPRRQSIRA